MQFMVKIVQYKMLQLFVDFVGEILKMVKKVTWSDMLPFFNQKKELINKCIFYIILYNIFIYNILY